MLEELLEQGQAPRSARRWELVTASWDVAVPLGGCSGQGPHGHTTGYTFITVGNLTALQRVLSQSIQFTALTCHGEGLLECLRGGAEKRKSGSMGSN